MPWPLPRRCRQKIFGPSGKAARRCSPPDQAMVPRTSSAQQGGTVADHRPAKDLQRRSPAQAEDQHRGDARIGDSPPGQMMPVPRKASGRCRLGQDRRRARAGERELDAEQAMAMITVRTSAGKVPAPVRGGTTVAARSRRSRTGLPWTSALETSCRRRICTASEDRSGAGVVQDRQSAQVGSHLTSSIAGLVRRSRCRGAAQRAVPGPWATLGAGTRVGGERPGPGAAEPAQVRCVAAAGRSRSRME